MCKTMNPKVMDPKFWETVRTDAEYKPFVDLILEAYAELKEEPILADLFSKFKLFEETGDRGEYEGPYFRKRRRLNVSALLTMIYPENPEYLQMLEEIIWAICDEYTWSLPAHLSHAVIPDVDRVHIDLFAAETGYALSEIVTVLKERINPRVYKRVCEEIDRRILTAFETTPDFTWLGGRSNWAAVCAGSVGVTFMYMAPDRFLKIKPKLDHTMETFLSGFSDDGICYEGTGYWVYGFGFFTAYAQHLYNFTDGKEDYFALEKVRKVAEFQRITDLGGVMLSFSDSGGGKVISSPGLYGVLQQHYPDIFIPAPETYTILDGCARWCKFFDAFVYLPKRAEGAPTVFERFSPHAGWFVKRTPHYGFAVKAGTNGEPHNHNDIGNFIFAANSKQLLCDLGPGKYTKQYFAKETRYDHLCNSAKGHSVPIIDGQLQQPGAEYKGTMQFADGVVTIDFGGAYDVDVSAVRKLTFTETGAVLTDTFEKQSDTVEVRERFVTCVAPTLTDAGVRIENLFLTTDGDWKVQIIEEVHIGHGGLSIPVYVLEYTSPAAQKLEFALNMQLEI